MKRIAYLDGVFMPYEEARIPLDDRALFFGDAVYDACLAMHGRVHTLPEHLRRLRRNAEVLQIPCRYSEDELACLLRRAASFFDGACFLYIQLSRTSEKRAHAYPDGAGSRLLITATDVVPPDGQGTVRLITARDVRYGLCSVKTVNLLPNVLASRAALEQGADEAVFIKDGYITECAHSNIFILQSGTLITRPTDGSILPGITRGRLLSLCTQSDISVEERAFTKEELITADDILVTSSSQLCRRALSVDGVAVGGTSSLAERLCEAMKEDFLRAVCE